MIKHSLNSAIRNEPYNGYECVQTQGDPLMDSRERNGKHIDQEGNLSFVVTSDGFSQEVIGVPVSGDGHDQKGIAEPGEQENQAIQRGWDHGEVCLSHPCRRERHERKPEEEVHVRPENAPIHVIGHLHQMVMIVPVDTEVHKAQDVREKERQDRH